jgi:hypothetical protein
MHRDNVLVLKRARPVRPGVDKLCVNAGMDGLSGIVSEGELHQIRMRLHQGERQKAARGPNQIGRPCSRSLTTIR